MNSRLRVPAALVLVTALLLLSASLVAAATVQLSGRVTDQSSNPQVASTVEVLNPGTTTVVASTTTNSTGSYSLSVEGGTYDVRVTPTAGSGFQQTSALGQAITSDRTLDFVLVPGVAVTVSGRVTDAAGTSLPNQVVQLHRSGGGPGGSATTDGSGRYSISVAPGDYALEVGGGRHRTDVSSLIPWSFGVNSSSALSITGDLALDLPLPAFHRVGLRVQDPAGGAVADVRIEPFRVPTTYDLLLGSLPARGSSNDFAVTGASGDAVLRLLPTPAPGRPNCCEKYGLIATPPGGAAVCLLRHSMTSRWIPTRA